MALPKVCSCRCQVEAVACTGSVATEMVGGVERQPARAQAVASYWAAVSWWVGRRPQEAEAGCLHPSTASAAGHSAGCWHPEVEAVAASRADNWPDPKALGLASQEASFAVGHLVLV